MIIRYTKINATVSTIIPRGFLVGILRLSSRASHMSCLVDRNVRIFLKQEKNLNLEIMFYGY